MYSTTYVHMYIRTYVHTYIRTYVVLEYCKRRSTTRTLSVQLRQFISVQLTRTICTTLCIHTYMSVYNIYTTCETNSARVYYTYDTARVCIINTTHRACVLYIRHTRRKPNSGHVYVHVYDTYKTNSVRSTHTRTIFTTLLVLYSATIAVHAWCTLLRVQSSYSTTMLS